ncbi:recombinase family protein [Lentibacillus cibarius]|uniref:Recombinase family protein n=1 Tax=Lentibacillus cibarius TaxID=2583219 RepID=A0A5S3QG97_9BACI|nr:recombinase family protein [Lentibacillus cibarius]TMN20954.1 recombinase family protein [Lentibacillus cibarius]
MIAIYLRVSTLEQVKDGYSIDAQRERLVAFCTAQGWNDYRFYVDQGVSAKDTERPELKQMFKDIKKGKISMILVYRLDRFTRRVIDLHEMLEEMEKYNCKFKSATEPYDTTTAMGRMFITIVAALAQWENENLSERIKMALEEKVSGGERVGGVPYGFDMTEDRKLIKNDKAPIVLDMINKIKSGMSAMALADFLNKTNNDKPVWRAQTVLRILKNPALYGATRWNDKVYENTHEGIISKDEFMKLQLILNDRTQHRRRDVTNTYIFQGVIACPSCGHPLSVNRYIRKRKDGSEHQFAMYRCQPCEKEKKFTKSINEHKIIDALYDYMRNVNIDNIETIEDTSESIYTDQLNQIEKKREKYQRAWASDLISDDEFKKLMDETKETFEYLKKKVNEYEYPVVVDKEALKQIVFTFNDNFRLLTLDEKRAFVSTFIRKIEIQVIPQPPKRPDKSKRGLYSIEITNVDFY